MVRWSPAQVADSQISHSCHFVGRRVESSECRWHHLASQSAHSEGAHWAFDWMVCPFTAIPICFPLYRSISLYVFRYPGMKLPDEFRSPG